MEKSESCLHHEAYKFNAPPEDGEFLEGLVSEPIAQQRALSPQDVCRLEDSNAPMHLAYHVVRRQARVSAGPERFAGMNASLG